MIRVVGNSKRRATKALQQTFERRAGMKRLLLAGAELATN
jgi:hypothetical protein